jgi:NADH-quinone oxidoreductase subunit L
VHPIQLQLYSISAMSQWLVAIPAMPLLGALTLGLFGRQLGRGNVALIGCATVAGSGLLGLLIILPMSFAGLFKADTLEQLYAISQSLGTWFQGGNVNVSAGLVVDHLSAVMLMVITMVGFFIHVYSVGYMEHEDDAGFARFFAYMNLFVGMMLILVLADGIVLMFVGWEGVGLCSYLLIGFWYSDEEKAAAGRKAMVVNRIGDLGFLLGIFCLFALFTSADFRALAQAADPAKLNASALAQKLTTGPFALGNWTKGEALTLTLLFLFIGACGKSAQLPLFVWLPDAMAGPTPVSALIHAATMVTAGVYMIARLNFLFVHSPTAMAVVTVVGAVTALFAALIALTQNDIKKVLAYSTISQLGYMFIGVGVGAYWAAIFHLLTHAFFKALLFLGAGSVMHGMGGETDIRKMGGLEKVMPRTKNYFLVGTLAITGALPISGFFSKEAILHGAHTIPNRLYEWAPHFAYWMGLLTAVLTGIYMWRLYYLTFRGEPRSTVEAHESPPVMTIPLFVLAFGAGVTALYGIPMLAVRGLGGSYVAQPIIENFLNQPMNAANEVLGIHGAGEGTGASPLAAVFAALGPAVRSWIGPWLLVFAAFLAARFLFLGGWRDRLGVKIRAAPAAIRVPAHVAYLASYGKFFVDEIYDVLVVAPVKFGSFLLWKIGDVVIIDGIISKATSRIALWLGMLLRLIQNGNVQRYAAVMAVALAVVLWALLKGA